MRLCFLNRNRDSPVIVTKRVEGIEPSFSDTFAVVTSTRNASVLSDCKPFKLKKRSTWCMLVLANFGSYRPELIHNICLIEGQGQMNIELDTMGERLKWARVQAGYTSAKLGAEATDTAYSTYSAHENGQNQFSAAIAEIYAGIYGVSAGWLLTGERAGDAGSGGLALSKNTRMMGIAKAGSFNMMRDTVETMNTPRGQSFSNLTQLMWEYQGDSMAGECIVDGDYIIGVEYGELIASGERLTEGQAVIVERIIPEQRLREVSLRRVHVLTNQLHFHVSAKTAGYDTMVTNHELESDDGYQIRVLAAVTAIWRPL